LVGEKTGNLANDSSINIVSNSSSLSTSSSSFYGDVSLKISSTASVSTGLPSYSTTHELSAAKRSSIPFCSFTLVFIYREDFLLFRDLRSAFEGALENYDLWLIMPLLTIVEALLDRSGNLPV
jgi:hypothetical protein